VRAGGLFLVLPLLREFCSAHRTPRAYVFLRVTVSTLLVLPLDVVRPVVHHFGQSPGCVTPYFSGDRPLGPWGLVSDVGMLAGMC
jgi:hypothetical protein